MSKISCGVAECSHNQQGACRANFVAVTGGEANTCTDTCCSSFLNKQIYSELTDSAGSEKKCDFVSCKVGSCKHNNSEICALETIQIAGEHVDSYEETNCLSFSDKRCCGSL